jgi:hypothetical protein
MCDGNDDTVKGKRYKTVAWTTEGVILCHRLAITVLSNTTCFSNLLILQTPCAFTVQFYNVTFEISDESQL